jgi:hypothetical protein
MPQEKKSKVADIEKLRKILDNPTDPTVKKLISEDDTALASIRKRLVGSDGKTQRTDSFLRKFDSFEPKVVVRSRQMPVSQPSVKPLPVFTPVLSLPEFEHIPSSMPLPTVASPAFSFTGEELYEIEKVDVVIPEFLEVTPKEATQRFERYAPSAPYNEPAVLDQKLPEWQPVDDTVQKQQHIQPETPASEPIPEFEPIESHMTPKPTTEKRVEWEPLPSTEPAEKPPEHVVEFQPVEPFEPSPEGQSKKEIRDAKKAAKQQQKEEKRLQKLERQKQKLEAKEKARQEKQRTKEQHMIQPVEEPLIQPENITEVESPPMNIDLSAFKGIESINQKTAELLYKNGYFSIDNLQEASVDDLVQIQGIKRKLAKQIKKEVALKTTVPQESEFIPMKEKISVTKPKETAEDLSEWESYHAEELEIVPTSKPAFSYDVYTLYKRETVEADGKKTTVHFFSKEKPADGVPSPIPDEYQMAVNKRTGVPYLRKKK